jgi:hypothetical protein
MAGRRPVVSTPSSGNRRNRREESTEFDAGLFMSSILTPGGCFAFGPQSKMSAWEMSQMRVGAAMASDGRGRAANSSIPCLNLAADRLGRGGRSERSHLPTPCLNLAADRLGHDGRSERSHLPTPCLNLAADRLGHDGRSERSHLPTPCLNLTIDRLGHGVRKEGSKKPPAGGLRRIRRGLRSRAARAQAG